MSLDRLLAATKRPLYSLASERPLVPASAKLADVDLEVARVDFGGTRTVIPSRARYPAESRAFFSRPQWDLPAYRTKPLYFTKLRDCLYVGHRHFIVHANGQLVAESQLYQGTRASYVPLPEEAPRGRYWRGAYADHPPVSEERPLVRVCSGAYANFFHWHTETLPAILLLRELGLDPAVKLALAPPSAWQRETLRLLGIPAETWVEIPDRLIELPALYFISAAELFQSQHLDTLLLTVFPRLLKAAGLSRSTDPHRNLYIARTAATWRRLRNEAELAGRLQSLGFEIVEAERLSYLEQLALMTEADVVVSPHGAGLTHLGFVPAGAQVFELTAEAHFLPHRVMYKHLSDLCGHEHHFILSADRGRPDQVQGETVKTWDIEVESTVRYIERQMERRNRRGSSARDLVPAA